jgi:signal transduction histidine kinase/ligand-binding sensor domain-containing protein/AraC-like DNA-binding protein
VRASFNCIKQIFAWIILLLSLNNVLCQHDEIKFTNYSIVNGLPSSSVMDITQDKYGFIWVTTPGGLYKFDGKEFQLHTIKSDTTTDANINLRYTFIDSKERFWIAATPGFYKYIPKTGELKHYMHEPEDPKSIANNLVTSFHEHKDSTLYIGTWFGLAKYIEGSDGFENIFFAEIPTVKTWVMEFCFDDKENIWAVAQAGGLIRYNLKTGEVKNCTGESKEFKTLMIGRLRGIVYDGTFLWITSFGHGLFRYNPLTEELSQFTMFREPPPTDFTLNTNHGNQLVDIIDHGKNLWITSEKCLTLFDKELKNYYPFYTEKSKFGNRLYSIEKDDQDGIWIGSNESGLFYFNLMQNQFKKYVFPLPSKVRNIFQLSDDTFLLNTYDQNHIYHINDNTLEPFNNIKVHFIDSKNRYWIEKNGKLHISAPNNINNTKEIDIGAKKQLKNPVFIEDKKGNIYRPGNNKLVKIDVQTGNNIEYLLDPVFDHFPEKNSVFNKHKFYVDNSNRFWLFSPIKRAVVIFRLNENGFVSIEKVIKDERIRTPNFFLHTGDQVWFNSRNGIIIYNNTTQKIKELTENDGFASSQIFSALEGKKGKIWIGTNFGLVKIDKEDLSVSNYTMQNGVLSNVFLKFCTQQKNGDLVFGHPFGITSFNPEIIRDKQNTPNIFITRLSIYNKELIPGKNSPLKKSILETEAIELYHKQASLAFEFRFLSYINPDNIIYAYKMEGLDEEWIMNGNNSRAAYSKIPPGEYTFRVAARDNNHAWNWDGDSLSVTILPPFWMTWWFRMLALAFIIISIYMIWQTRIRSLKKRQKMLEQTVKERTAEIMIQKEEIESQRDNLKKANVVLNEQKAEIETQRDHLKEVNVLLNEQKEEIETQSQELALTNEELQKLNATKDKFFSIIAHDLKNPFHAIKGFSQVLIRDFDELGTGQVKEFISTIERSSATASNLLENLLEWSRSQTNRIKFNPEDVNLSALVDENISLLKINAGNKKIKLMNDTGDDIYVFGDRNMLTTIIRNLLNNSIKFTEKGGKITIKTEESENMVILAVADTGIGMSNEVKEKLFRIDQSVAQTGTAGEAGTGLGLIICKEFVEKNNGTIWVESELNKGTTFFVKIPKGKKTADEHARGKAKPAEHNVISEENSPKNKKKEKVLIAVIEDNTDIRMSIVADLSKYFSLIEAANGRKGLEMIIEKSPDLIISDWMMPEMDGVELCKKIKTDKRTSHIPVILLTAKSEVHDKVEGLETGADDYITKPFDSAILKARIDNILKNRQIIREKIISELFVDPHQLPFGSIDKKFIEKAFQTIEKNIDNPDFGVNSFSKDLSISLSYLNKKIKSLFGQSPSEFIRTMRLKKAARLIIEKQMNVSEVVHEVGFTERTYFSRSFSKLFGMSPNEYRKKYSK